MAIFQSVLLTLALLFSWYTWYQNVFMCHIAMKTGGTYHTNAWLPFLAASLWATFVGTFL